MSKLLEELKYRDLIYQQTDEEGIKKLLEKEKVSIYCGTDPTGDSLHVGHLLPFLTLKRFASYGHKPVVLVGGATGIIGDPSGRKEERKLQTLDVIKENAKKLENQLKNIFRDNENITFLNNEQWLSKITMLEFLRDYGKLININYMLAKDSVASRIENGLSFTEFSYSLLQAIDFNYLNSEYGVKMQLGGSDQWGNIVSGLEIMRKLRGEVEAYGFTIPLMLKSDGTKFGKSAGGAVWLDPEKTSPYEFYQFFFNTSDEDVINTIKKFTFLDKNTIEKLEKSLKENPHLREAQKTLASEMVKIVHGEEALESALRVTNALFSGDITSLNKKEFSQIEKSMPKVNLDKKSYKLVEFLVDSKLVSSKRQSREDITNGAISVNGKKIKDLEYQIEEKDIFNEKYLVLRKGKKKYLLVEFN